MSGFYSVSKSMRHVLNIQVYEMLIKNSGISQIYGRGGNCNGNNNKSWVAIFFFLISFPLSKLEGTLTKLTMFIECFCFGGRSHCWVNDNEPRLCLMLYHPGLTPLNFQSSSMLHKLCSYRNFAGSHQVKIYFACGVCRVYDSESGSVLYIHRDV